MVVDHRWSVGRLGGEMSLAFAVSVWRFTAVKFSPHHSLTQLTHTRQAQSISEYFTITLQAEGNRATAIHSKVYPKQKGSPGTRLTGWQRSLSSCSSGSGDYCRPPKKSFRNKGPNKFAFRRDHRAISRLKLVERLSSVCNSMESTPRSGY